MSLSLLVSNPYSLATSFPLRYNNEIYNTIIRTKENHYDLF